MHAVQSGAIITLKLQIIFYYTQRFHKIFTILKTFSDYILCSILYDLQTLRYAAKYLYVCTA